MNNQEQRIIPYYSPISAKGGKRRTHTKRNRRTRHKKTRHNRRTTRRYN